MAFGKLKETLLVHEPHQENPTEIFGGAHVHLVRSHGGLQITWTTQLGDPRHGRVIGGDSLYPSQLLEHGAHL